MACMFCTHSTVRVRQEGDGERQRRCRIQRCSPDCPPHDVVPVQPFLAPVVQRAVVAVVVVALCGGGGGGTRRACMHALRASHGTGGGWLAAPSR